MKVLNDPLSIPYNPAYYTVPRQSRYANSDENVHREDSKTDFSHTPIV